MIEHIYSEWQKRLKAFTRPEFYPLFQRKELFHKLLKAVFSDRDSIYYLLPEIIDYVESNNLDFKGLLDALFILRDQVLQDSAGLNEQQIDTGRALNLLQELIIKIGAYFAHLKMDLNIKRSNVYAIDSERIEGNILHLNKDFIIEKTNSRVLTYFGYEKHEIIGKPLNYLFSQSSQTIINNALIQLKKNLRFRVELEVEALHKEKQNFQALLKISRINIKEEPPRYSAYIQDNSYIHETKSMLNLMSMALESVGEGIFILEPDEQGKILYVNEAMESMSGFARHQLLGKPFAILRNHPNSDELEKEIIQSSRQSGWQGEITNRNKKGKPYIVHMHTKPVKDEYGKIIAIVGISRDITKQKAREEEIIHLQEFVEHIINNLPQFVFVTDQNLRIKFWNYSLEENLRIPAEEVINRSVTDVLPQLKRFHLDMVVKNVLKTGEMFSKKFLADFTNSGDQYYHLFINPISTDKEKQLLWTLQDITKEELLKVRITWQNARLKFLENFSQLLNTNLDIQSIFRRFAEELKEILPFKTLSFLLPKNPEKFQFNLFFISRDGKEEFPQNIVIDASDNPIYKKVIRTGAPQIQNLNQTANSKSAISNDESIGDGLGQVIHFPIIFEKETLGILNVGHEEADFYKQGDIDFLQQIASHLSIALKNSFYFNLIELQNKKLSIINSIFNIPQHSDHLPQIYEKALKGLLELIQCDNGAFYRSEDGENWYKISIIEQSDSLPEYFHLPVDNLTGRTYFWDKYNPPLIDIISADHSINYESGIFTWEDSSVLGHLAFLSINNPILIQIKPDFLGLLLEDVIKQMTIAIDRIHLFNKVKQAEDEWETTFNTVDIGLLVVDSEFRIVQINRALNDLFRKDTSNWIGKPCSATFCGLADLTKCCKHIVRELKDKPYDMEYHHKEIDRTLKTTFYPILGEDKKFRGGVFSIYDITEQRRQEAKIQFLSTFPETNPNLVISIDQDGNIHYLNPAVKKLLKELNLPEEKVSELLPGGLEALIDRFHHKEKSYLEMDYQFRDRVFHYIVYRSSDNNHFYIYGTDVTEKVNLQNQLLQTERIRAVGEMAAGVAHDFNNLLATILGRTQLLLLKSDNQSVINELKIIEKAAIDGGQIVKRMQEVTREKRDRNYQPVDINEIIKESIILSANKLKISTQLKGKQVQLHTEFGDQLVVKGNPVELKEVFTNLLLNAYDAMPNGGDLYITTKKTDDSNVQIIIKDTGMGMPEEIKNKIFNPFFTTKGEKGTGLGLSIVYKTVASHSGNIKVESEINKGTTFTINLPFSSEPVQSQARKELFLHEKSGAIRLLIVDDEPELLETMAEILRLKFKSVEIAPDGEEALNKIEKNEYDVVLTDLGMPEMSGWEVARLVKKKLPKSRVILVTGWGEQAREELSHHPYVDEILGKPYELQQLMNTIGKFFNGKKN